MRTDRNFVLLTGAGFSKNWGGLLAYEVFDALLAAKELDNPTREMLYRANEPGRGGFETVLGTLQAATDVQGIARRDALTAALVRIFTDMGAAFSQMHLEFAAQPDANNGVTGFLRRFHAIYTTNQDTLIEQKYIPVSGPVRAAYLPGVKYTDPGAMRGFELDRAGLMQPDPQNFTITTGQPYFKLHGSVNWMDAGQRLLIMGGGKSTTIKNTPLLSWYHEELRRALVKPGARLMVIGYSFGDPHINEIILEAVRTAQLKIFIVDPAGTGILDKRDKTASIPIPKPQDQEDLENSVIGVSGRPISSTFDKDVYANSQLMRFFDD